MPTFLDLCTVVEVARSASALPVVGSLKETIIRSKPHPNRLRRTAHRRTNARRRRRATKLGLSLGPDTVGCGQGHVAEETSRSGGAERERVKSRQHVRAYRETPWPRHVIRGNGVQVRDWGADSLAHAKPVSVPRCREQRGQTGH